MRNKHITWFMLLLMVPVLACSLVDRVTNAVSSQVSVGAESATRTPVSTLAPALEETGDENVEPANPAPPPAESAPSENIPFTGVTNLNNLSSYRVTFTMEFNGVSEGQPAEGRVEMALDSTSSPPARYLALTMAGTMLSDLGGYNSTQFYEVGDKIYLYNEAAGEGQWLAMESGGPGSETFREGFFTPDKDLELPQTVQCSATPEVVNNVSATHCTFSEKDVHAADASFESLTGNIWIAETDNYIVKYTMEATGYHARAEDQGLFDVGDVIFEYNLMDINADFAITPPAEALNAESLDFGSFGESSDSAETETPEFPVPDDAEDLFSMAGLTTYYTGASVETVVDFYRQSLVAEGWQEDANGAYVDETTALLSFTKEGQALTITVGKEDSRTNVGLIVTE